ncbi:MAG: hypothetical protein QXP81_09960 [Nitrososphaerota archaeon]
MRRENVGAMEALTVIVLAVAAIVLAAVVWIFLLGSTQTQTAAPDFVFDVSLISLSSGCRMVITIKNTGSVPIDSATIYVSGALSASIGGPLPPGRSVSSNTQVACQGPGESVVVEVEAQAGQNTVRKAARVVVQ